jgi:D-serine deaminase-like pyridoxal phosphate-dependent protein
MRDPGYFRALSEALRQVGACGPRMIIDLDRLDANIDLIARGAARGVALRIVDKSLPSIDLMKRVMARIGARKVMSFHLPVTLALLEAMPDIDVLYGKPLPVPAFSAALTRLEQGARQRLLNQTVFLVDTAERLRQISALAAEASVVFRIAFEVDVGMHRGGIADPQALAGLVRAAVSDAGLRIEGLMAYEAHIPEIPGLFGGVEGEAAKVSRRLADFAAVLPENARAIINTGGSKTVLVYADAGAANEISVGSAFVKPTDFDKPSLAALKPAAFIATPVLKVVDALLPGPLAVTRALQALRLFGRKGCFLYGGNWLAKPVFPAGMVDSSLWGHSSNQQFMALPADSDVKVDDFAFFRPTQSEALLQQFGPLLLYSNGKISGEWLPVPLG